MNEGQSSKVDIDINFVGTQWRGAVDSSFPGFDNVTDHIHDCYIIIFLSAGCIYV